MGDNLLGLGVNALANEFEMERLRMRQENQPQQPHQPGIDFGGMGSGMSGGSGMGGSRYDPPSSAFDPLSPHVVQPSPFAPGTAGYGGSPASRLLSSRGGGGLPPPPTVPPPPAVPTPPAVGITAPSFDHQSDEALLDTSLGSSLDALGSSLERAMFGSPRRKAADNVSVGGGMAGGGGADGGRRGVGAGVGGGDGGGGIAGRGLPRLDPPFGGAVGGGEILPGGGARAPGGKSGSAGAIGSGLPPPTAVALPSAPGAFGSMWGPAPTDGAGDGESRGLHKQWSIW